MRFINYFYLYPKAKFKFMLYSKMADTLVGSEIIKIASEVNDLKKSGKQISNLTIGDFNPEHYPIPEKFRDYINAAYKKGFTNYPPAGGVLALTQSISKFIQKNFGLEYRTEEIQVSGGSRPLIYALYLSLLDNNDKVVFPVPSWNNNHYCHLTGASPVMVMGKPENNFMPTAEDFKPHLKGAVILALCSPLNPTGTMFSEQGLKEICEMVLEENAQRSPSQKPLILMYDQIYSLLTYGKHQHFNPVKLVPAMRDYTVNIDGASKGFASTGVRVGWAFGPQRIMEKMKAIISHIGAWAPTAEQNAMGEFLSNSENVEEFLNDHKFKLQRSLEALYRGIKSLKEEGLPVDAIEPMGAIYLTLKIDILGKKTPEGLVLNNSMEVTLYLIHQAGLALVPFTAFGDSNNSPWFRASVGACSFKEIEQVMPRLKSSLSALV